MRTDPSAVISAGLHIVDVLGRPVTHIPDGQGVAFLDEITMTVAGTAAATSADLARLGVAVAAVGAVGNDVMGQFLRSRMASLGIDVTHLVRLDGVPTSATMLPIRPNGERPALHVIGANAFVTEDLVPWDLVSRARVFHMGGTFLLPGLDGEPTARVLRRVKELGLTVTMDFIPGGRADAAELLAPALPYVDYLLPNLEDAAFVAGRREADRAGVIAWYHDRGVGCTILTMGADGVSIARRGEPETRLPAFDIDVVDTTGCGDAFTAGFITGLLDGRSLLECAERGLACGSLVATGLGSDAGLVDQHHLLDFIATTPRRQLAETAMEAS
ncbi:sugar kinase [Micromonospora sp. NPDC007271]|uniref:carbohydrate kinase family protein n=1 Tax=Micromonospora sp. NPDC007271 TaxID=3154587 RepID=UPI00340D5161